MTEVPPDGAQVTVSSLSGAVLAQTVSDAQGRYSVVIDQATVGSGLRFSATRIAINGERLNGTLSAIYGPGDSLSQANITLLTTLVTRLGAEQPRVPIKGRTIAVDLMHEIGMILEPREWFAALPRSLDLPVLRSFVLAQGIDAWTTSVVADLADRDLSSNNLTGFPNAHGGIDAISFGNRTATVAFPGDEASERVVVSSALIPKPRYSFQLLAGPGFATLSPDGGLTYKIPDTQAAGSISLEVRATNPSTGRGRMFSSMLFVMLTTVLVSGEVGAAGGRIADPWQDVVLTVPPNAVTGTASFDILRGELPDGQYAYKTRTTAELHAPIQLTTPSTQARAAELNATTVNTPLIFRSPREQRASQAETAGRKAENGWTQWKTWDALLLVVPSASGTHVNRLRNDLARFNDVPNLPGVAGVPEKVVSELFSRCGSQESYAAQCNGREPVLFIHGFVPPNFLQVPLSLAGLATVPPLGGGTGYWDQFPEQLSNTVSATGKRYAVFEFNWMTAAGFRDVADDLAKAIKLITNQSGQQVHIVAHSFGGLLARTYLQGFALQANGESRPYDNDVASLTTLGTPHSGIFNDAGKQHGQQFPKGQNHFFDTFILCNALSCNDAGEPTPDSLNYEDTSLHFYFNASPKVGNEETPGELVAALANGAQGSAKLPVPTQVLIGMPKVDEYDNSTGVFLRSFLNDGDGLISFAGQRLHPTLSCAGSTCANKRVSDSMPRLQEFALENIAVVEKILSFGEDRLPGQSPLLSVPFNYRHTKGFIGGSNLGDVGEAAVGGRYGCTVHEGCKEVVTWIDANPSKRVTTGTIRYNFRVVDAITGVTIAGARIAAGDGAVTAPIATDSSGRSSGSFAFTARKTYTVYVAAEGYRTDPFDSLMTGNTTTGTVNFPLIRLRPNADAPTLGQLGGKVTASGSGTPLDAVIVSAIKVGQVTPIQTARTTVDGSYSFQNLPEGNYQFRFSNPGYRELLSNFTINPATSHVQDAALVLDNNPAAPVAPALVSVDATAPDHIQFRFRDLSTNEASFDVERRLGTTGVFVNVARRPLSPGSNFGVVYDDATTAANTTYCYRVRAVNARGMSAYSQTGCDSTPAGPAGGIPAGPTAASAAPATGGGILFQFRDSANNEFGFRIERRMGTTGSYGLHTFLASAAGNDVLQSYTDRSATGDQPYCYRAIAYNASGVSVSSGEACTRPNGRVVMAPRITRVSVSTDGTQALFPFFPLVPQIRPAISADGRFVVFASVATTLVPEGTNGHLHIFVRDRDTDRDGIFDEQGSVSTKVLSCVSNGGSTAFAGVTPSISADGRFVAFGSSCPDLASDDTNGRIDIFVRDRDSDRDGIFDEPGSISTTLISRNSDGVVGIDESQSPSISTNGRFVAFESLAANFADDGFGTRDIFVRDRDTDVDGMFDESGSVFTTLLSRNSDGGIGSPSVAPSISANGRFVTFSSVASNLVEDDANDDSDDVFVRDRDTDVDGIFDEPGSVSTTLLSRSSDGTRGNSDSVRPSISADGRFVAFESAASNLVTNDTNETSDVFVRDRDTDRDGIFDEPGSVSTILLSRTSGGVPGNSTSYSASISADGRFVAFESTASNFGTNDTNEIRDVFVRDRDTDGDGIFDEPGGVSTTLVSSSGEVPGGSFSSVPSISPDGRFIAFESFSALVADDTNGYYDVFVVDRAQVPPN